MSIFQKFQSGKSQQSRLSMYIVLLFLVLLSLVYSACSASNSDATATSTSTPQSATGGSTSYPVKIYFSKMTSSDFTTVFPVNRIAPTSAVGTYSIQQLIIGPTAAESSAGYISTVHNEINGPSNCPSGQDFTLTLNKKGAQDQAGTATLHFCRALSSAGIGDDARVISEVHSTLLQFSTIKKVIVLTNTGHCLGDESGSDHCLQ